MAAPARALQQCRWSAGALLQPLLLLAIVVGLSAACLGPAHAHGAGEQGYSTEPAVVTGGYYEASEVPTVANGERVFVGHSLAAGESHPEPTCHEPLSATLRQSRTAAAANPVGLALAAAPPAALSEAVQNGTAHPWVHGHRWTAGHGQLLDLLCVSRI